MLIPIRFPPFVKTGIRAMVVGVDKQTHIFLD